MPIALFYANLILPGLYQVNLIALINLIIFNLFALCIDILIILQCHYKTK